MIQIARDELSEKMKIQRTTKIKSSNSRKNKKCVICRNGNICKKRNDQR